MEYMKGGMLYDVLAEEKMLSEKVIYLTEKVAFNPAGWGVNTTDHDGRLVELLAVN